MCIKVYHNSRWSKSRDVIQLLRDNNIDFTIIEYLKKPLSTKSLTKICKLLAIEPDGLIRKNDSNFKALGINLSNMNFDQIIELISNNPKIMERPIITNKTAGIIGRPPELVKKLI